MTKNTDKAKASAPETRDWGKGKCNLCGKIAPSPQTLREASAWAVNHGCNYGERTIPAEKPTGVAVYYGDELPPSKTWLPKPPTLQEHIADLMDAATRFEDRAKRAEAHADALAEALADCLELGVGDWDGEEPSFIKKSRKALAAYEESK